MRHTFLFLAVLCSTMLTACDGPEINSARAGNLVTESNNSVNKSTELPAPAGEIADTRPAEKLHVKTLSVSKALALAQKSSCLECHSIDNKVVGPAWMDVSRKYKGVKGIEDRLVVKVSTGGYGNWGNMPMPALAPDVKEKDIRTLVRFILSLAK